MNDKSSFKLVSWLANDNDSSVSDKLKIEQATKQIDHLIVALEGITQYDERIKLWKALLDVDEQQNERSPEFLAQVNIKHAFKSFLKNRRKEKIQVYRSIVIAGFMIMALSVLVFLILSILDNSNPNASVLSQVLFVLSTFGRVVGILIYSTVPTTEFDLFFMMSQPEHRVLKLTFSIICGIVFIVGPILYLQATGGYVFNYAVFAFIPIGVWMLFNVRPVSYENIVWQFLVVVVAIPLVCSVMFSGNSPIAYTYSAIYFACGVIEIIVILMLRRQN